MAQFKITVQTVAAQSAVAVDHIDADITDSTGATQTVEVVASSSPANSAVFSIPEGAGSILLTTRDANGDAIGTPVGPTAFDTASLPGGVNDVQVASAFTLERVA